MPSRCQAVYLISQQNYVKKCVLQNEHDGEHVYAEENQEQVANTMDALSRVRVRLEEALRLHLRIDMKVKLGITDQDFKHDTQETVRKRKAQLEEEIGAIDFVLDLLLRY
jgi:hypothetical protein